MLGCHRATARLITQRYFLFYPVFLRRNNLYVYVPEVEYDRMDLSELKIKRGRRDNSDIFFFYFSVKVGDNISYLSTKTYVVNPH